MSYARGTDAETPPTLARPTQSETLLIAASLVAKGCVVVASHGSSEPPLCVNEARASFDTLK